MYYKKLVSKELYLSPSDIENETPIMTKWINEDNDIIIGNGFYQKLLGTNKVKEMLEKWNEGPYMFSIVNNEGEFMGHINLFDVYDHEYATLGIYLGKEYRNKGYASIAIKLLADYAFNYLNLRAIHLHVFAYNTHAQQVYQKLGFKECGRWHNVRYMNGKYYDEIMMELLKP